MHIPNILRLHALTLQESPRKKMDCLAPTPKNEMLLFRNLCVRMWKSTVIQTGILSAENCSVPNSNIIIYLLVHSPVKCRAVHLLRIDFLRSENTKIEIK